MTLRAVIAAVAVLAAPAALGGDPPKPGPRDKCPVCGMFVAKYPDWVGYVELADGTRLVFDGAKRRIAADVFQFGRIRLKIVELVHRAGRGEIGRAQSRGEFALLVGRGDFAPCCAAARVWSQTARSGYASGCASNCRGE